MKNDYDSPACIHAQWFIVHRDDYYMSSPRVFFVIGVCALSPSSAPPIPLVQNLLSTI